MVPAGSRLNEEVRARDPVMSEGRAEQLCEVLLQLENQSFQKMPSVVCF